MFLTLSQLGKFIITHILQKRIQDQVKYKEGHEHWHTHTYK